MLLSIALCVDLSFQCTLLSMKKYCKLVSRCDSEKDGKKIVLKLLNPCCISSVLTGIHAVLCSLENLFHKLPPICKKEPRSSRRILACDSNDYQLLWTGQLWSSNMDNVYERVYIYITFACLHTCIYRKLRGFPSRGTEFVNYILQTPELIQKPPTPQSSWHLAKILMFETEFSVSKGKP